MKIYRRPIQIVVTVVAVVLLIVGGLSALRGVIWKYNAPVEPVATRTGIYWVSAVKEPELAHTWQSEHHTLYREDEVWIALDGDRAYRLDPETKRLRKLVEGLELDWSLEVVAFHYVEYAGKTVCFYFPPEEPIWAPVEGYDGNVMWRTLVRIENEVETRTLVPANPAFPQAVRYTTDSQYWATMTERGELLATRKNVVAADPYSLQEGETVFCRDSMRYLVQFDYEQDRMYIECIGTESGVRTNRDESAWVMHTDLAKHLRQQEQWRVRETLHLTNMDVLLCGSKVLDEAPGITVAQLNRAVYADLCAAIETDTHTQVYCYYSNDRRTAWARYDLP